MQIELPSVGLAIMVADLERHHNWLIEGQRDLEIQDFCDPLVLNDWESCVSESKRWLEGYEGRLGIHGAFYNLPIDAIDPEIRTVVQRRLDQALEASEALKGTHIVVHSPISTWDYNHFGGDPLSRDALFERCHATLGPAVKRAEQIGCTLVIENIEDKNPTTWAALARSFNSPAVACSLDTGHAHYAHGSTGAPPVDYYVLAAGPDLAHIHLQDADGYADRHWLPGEGTIRWHAIFEALRLTGANPRLVVEPNARNRPRIRDGADWLIAEGLAR